MRTTLDLYTDYLLSSFGQTSANNLARLMDDQLSHDLLSSSRVGKWSLRLLVIRWKVVYISRLLRQYWPNCISSNRTFFRLTLSLRNFS